MFKPQFERLIYDVVLLRGCSIGCGLSGGGHGLGSGGQGFESRTSVVEPALGTRVIGAGIAVDCGAGGGVSVGDVTRVVGGDGPRLGDPDAVDCSGLGGNDVVDCSRLDSSRAVVSQAGHPFITTSNPSGRGDFSIDRVDVGIMENDDIVKNSMNVEGTVSKVLGDVAKEVLIDEMGDSSTSFKGPNNSIGPPKLGELSCTKEERNSGTGKKRVIIPTKYNSDFVSRPATRRQTAMEARLLDFIRSWRMVKVPAGIVCGC